MHAPGTNCLGLTLAKVRNVPNTLIVIPARMQATRLPGKPMVDIGGAPMIVHVWRRAVAANAGRVVVATDAAEVVSAIEAAGGEAVMTRADHASGSDRIFEAVTRIDPDAPRRHRRQPAGRPSRRSSRISLPPASAPLSEPGTDIATLAAEIVEAEERTNPNVVKVVGSPLPTSAAACARSTSRAPPPPPARVRSTTTSASTRTGARRLQRFVSLQPSPLELREKLEQLRALEAGMRIDVTVVDTVPLGVDTPADLERARRRLNGAR